MLHLYRVCVFHVESVNKQDVDTKLLRLDCLLLMVRKKSPKVMKVIIKTFSRLHMYK